MPKLPLLLIAAMFIMGAVAYPNLPDRIPVHWGVSGQIDGWAPTTPLSAFGIPLMAIGIYLLFWFMPYLDPKRGNLIGSKQVYDLILELVTGLFTVLYAASLMAAFNQKVPVDKVVTVAVSVMFLVLGNYMGRVKRNWTMGVRYSWTLSDDTVWFKTNRLAGRLFMLSGALGILGVFLPPPFNFALLMAPLLLLVPITYVYSWRLYRKLHPEEMEPAERV
jgi:uncharacterized membrane protein